MKDYINIQSVIDGCLLGDGCLELNKNGKNASFRYISSSKQHVEFVHSYFKEYCTEDGQKIKRSEYFDKRTNKTYVHYYFRTKCLPIFTEQHNRYYKNGIKIIPNDLNIDKTVLLFWYIGDGELESKYGYVKLHTNCFNKTEVDTLCYKLFKFNAKPLKKTDNQFLVTIPRNNVKKFLNLIGECPFEDYKHKWKFVEYKNKNIEKNGINYYSNIYPDIIKEYFSKGLTIYGLSKKYNVPIKAILNHFEKNNIKTISINIKKKIVQYDINENLINEWESGQEIHKKLNYNASAISECCRGVRKKYKNFIWKFKN